MEDFVEFDKIPRLFRKCYITEKIDGTNAQICITENGEFYTGSRNRWVTPEDDNYGFSRWAHEHKEELMQLGVGHHYGEWYGQGIQRGYGLKEKRFVLFNTSKWSGPKIRPACCEIVPILYSGVFDTNAVRGVIEELSKHGSYLVDGFMRPEGVVIYHVTLGGYFKVTVLNDDTPKSKLQI